MPALSPSAAAGLDHTTLVAAVAHAATAESRAARRDACKVIAAQVYRVVAAVLGPGSPDVSDASQEAFMRVYKAIPAFEPDPERPHGPKAWVNQIALHAALDRLKHQERTLDRAGDDDPIEPFASDDPDDTIDRKQLVSALLERLDERERAVLVLRYWSGETDEEIAETLGLPLGTVKTRLRTAGAKLRRRAPIAMEPLQAPIGEGLKA